MMRGIIITLFLLLSSYLIAQSTAIERLDSVQRNSSENDFKTYLSNHEMAFLYGNYLFALSNDSLNKVEPYLYYRLNHKSQFGQWKKPWIENSSGRPYFVDRQGVSKGEFVRERLSSSSSIEVKKTEFGEFYIMFVQIKSAKTEHTEIIALHFTDNGSTLSISEEKLSLKKIFEVSGKEVRDFYGEKQLLFHNHDKSEWFFVDRQLGDTGGGRIVPFTIMGLYEKWNNRYRVKTYFGTFDLVDKYFIKDYYE